MGFKFMGVVMGSKYPIPFDVKKYVCTSSNDIANLPKVYVDGKSDNEIDNSPCWYGSEAVVLENGRTSVHMLGADNNWTKMGG